MQKKLTLSINEHIIERAKSYAKNTGRSLSEIIESYLEKITKPEQDEDEDKELKQILGIISLPEDFDEKEAIREIQYNKHIN